MLIVHVHIRVKPDRVEAFKAACIENSRNSLKSRASRGSMCSNSRTIPPSSCWLRSTERPTRPPAHKQTAHYQRWAETVADMMAMPRSSVKFDKVYPEGGLP